MLNERASVQTPRASYTGVYRRRVRRLTNTTCVANFSRYMHGICDATQNWQRKSAGTVQVLGFTTGRVSPCHFDHERTVHGDDFVFVGSAPQRASIAEHMGRKLKMTVMFTGKEDRNEMRTPERIIRWAPRGVMYE